MAKKKVDGPRSLPGDVPDMPKGKPKGKTKDKPMELGLTPPKRGTGDKERART